MKELWKPLPTPGAGKFYFLFERKCRKGTDLAKRRGIEEKSVWFPKCE